MSQKISIDFVNGYALNLCGKRISVVPYNHNIRKRRRKYGGHSVSEK